MSKITDSKTGGRVSPKQRMFAVALVLLAGAASPHMTSAQDRTLDAMREKANAEFEIAREIAEGKSSVSSLVQSLRSEQNLRAGGTPWIRAQTAMSIGHHLWAARRGNEAVKMFELADELIGRSLRAPGLLKDDQQKAYALATRANLRTRYLNRGEEAAEDVENASRLDPDNSALTKRLRKAVDKAGKGRG